MTGGGITLSWTWMGMWCTRPMRVISARMRLIFLGPCRLYSWLLSFTFISPFRPFTYRWRRIIGCRRRSWSWWYRRAWRRRRWVLSRGLWRWGSTVAVGFILRCGRRRATSCWSDQGTWKSGGNCGGARWITWGLWMGLSASPTSRRASPAHKSSATCLTITGSRLSCRYSGTATRSCSGSLPKKCGTNYRRACPISLRSLRKAVQMSLCDLRIYLIFVYLFCILSSSSKTCINLSINQSKTISIYISSS